MAPAISGGLLPIWTLPWNLPLLLTACPGAWCLGKNEENMAREHIKKTDL